jgi:transcriptional regulator with XRE-family HTH domain
MTANRISEFRQKLGISQVELARRTRMASTNLSAIERGKLEAWPKVKKALCRVLKVTPEELFPEG